MVTTRHRTRHQRGPLPLRRMSAMRPIRFIGRGRRQARKLCLDADRTYMLYFSTLDGVTSHHLLVDTSELVFSDPECIPEYVYAM